MDTINGRRPATTYTRAIQRHGPNAPGLHATFTRFGAAYAMDTFRGLVSSPIEQTLKIHTRTHAEMVAADTIVRVDGWRMVGIPSGSEW